jgi:hypothetical protein
VLVTILLAAVALSLFLLVSLLNVGRESSAAAPRYPRHPGAEQQASRSLRPVSHPHRVGDRAEPHDDR